MVHGFLEDIGLIESRGEGQGYRLAKDIQHRLVYWYGDRKSIIQIMNMVPRLRNEEARANVDDADLATTLLAALRRVHLFPGDLHILMHMLHVIFRVYYGAFLQCFQTVLRWKRIQMDPVPRCARPSSICLLSYVTVCMLR